MMHQLKNAASAKEPNRRSEMSRIPDLESARSEWLQRGTLVTFVGAAIADAAFPRSCGTNIFATQHTSRKQPFKLAMGYETQTAISPQPGSTVEERTLLPFKEVLFELAPSSTIGEKGLVNGRSLPAIGGGRFANCIRCKPWTKLHLGEQILDQPIIAFCARRYNRYKPGHVQFVGRHDQLVFGLEIVPDEALSDVRFLGYRAYGGSSDTVLCNYLERGSNEIGVTGVRIFFSNSSGLVSQGAGSGKSGNS
jgi:hypothetical protein